MAFPTGSEAFAAVEIRALRRRGVDVSVHSLRPAFPFAERTLAERGLSDLPVTHGNLSNQFRGLVLGVFHPLLVWTLLRYIVASCWRRPGEMLRCVACVPRSVQIFFEIKRARPDVVHLYWGHYPALVGHLVLQHLPKTVLSTSLSAYDLFKNYECSKPVARSADCVRTWGRVNVSAIENYGVASDRIKVFYQGIDLQSRQGKAAVSKVPRRIISVGRLVAAKGMHYVLEAFRQILADWPDASLVIAGDGADRSQLEQMACDWGLEKSVRFTGHVSQAVLFDEMANAEVFLLISHHGAERLPNVAKEAIASECFCIVTDTPGIEEVVEDAVHGYVIPQRDVQAAVQRVKDVFADGEKHRAMAQSARSYVHDAFDVDTITQEMIEHWTALCSRKQAESGHRAHR